MSNNELSAIVAATVQAVQAMNVNPTSANPAPQNRAALEAELARLQGEVAERKARKPKVEVTPVEVKPTQDGDKMLLAIIKKFQSKPRTDGKPAGTLAVKVHAYLKACGIEDAKVRGIVQSAEKRHVISAMTVPIKNGPNAGSRMAIYFDFKERPVDRGATSVDQKEAKGVLAAFGL